MMTSDVDHGDCPITASAEGTGLEEPVLNRVTLLYLVPVDKIWGKLLTQRQAAPRLTSNL